MNVFTYKILDQRYYEEQEEQLQLLARHVNGSASLPLFNGELEVAEGVITIALMTIPNLLGMLWLHKEVKTEVKSFWNEYAERFPEEKPPRY